MMEGLQVIRVAIDKEAQDNGVIEFRLGDLPSKTIAWNTTLEGDVEIPASLKNDELEQALINEVEIQIIEKAWEFFR
jgi:hypothetical protein